MFISTAKIAPVFLYHLPRLCCVYMINACPGAPQVTIPSFDLRGLLPPFNGPDATTFDRSPYVAGMTELVQAFGTTPQRKSLLSNLITYRTLLASDGYQNGIQFIDGSFVENIEATAGRPPGDIDVFSLVNVPPKYLGAAGGTDWTTTGLRFWTEEVADRNKNKLRFSLDTYAALYEELAGSPSGLIRGVIYWYSLFSHQRNTLAWKGFVAVPLNPADDATAQANLGGT